MDDIFYKIFKNFEYENPPVKTSISISNKIMMMKIKKFFIFAFISTGLSLFLSGYYLFMKIFEMGVLSALKELISSFDFNLVSFFDSIKIIFSGIPSGILIVFIFNAFAFATVIYSMNSFKRVIRKFGFA